MEIPIIYTPHQNQIAIHKSKAKNRIGVCGRRFGKSALAINEAIATSFQIKNHITWIILPIQKQAREVYWVDPDITKYFIPYVQAGLVERNDTHLSLYFKSTNSWIRLKGSDNPDNLRGSGIDLLIWDEVDDVKQEAFDVIAPALADSPNHRSLYIGTPKGISTLHEFALRGDHKQQIPSFGRNITPSPDWETFHFTSYDNMSFKEGTTARDIFVAYIDNQRKELEEKGKLGWFNQEYMASFQETSGRFFTTWSFATHTTPIRMPKPTSLKFAGMDWGRIAPFAFPMLELEVVNYEGLKFNRIYVYDEVYGVEKSPREWFEVINKIEPVKNFSAIYGDPAMFTKGNDNSISIADQFKREGLVIKPASNSRINGWSVMVDWFRIAPDGKPYLIIAQRCKNLVREIQEAIHDERKTEDIDTLNCSDHILDGTRYILGHIKWVNAELGVARKQEERRAGRFMPMNSKMQPIALDLDSFEKEKRRRRR